jgi:hypothetical protein
MTKAEALAKIEEAKANIASLESYVGACGQKEAARPIAERFTTAAGRTGVILSIPEDCVDSATPICEYLIREFIARGGVVWNAEERIKVWRTARFLPAGPLWHAWNVSAEKTYKSLPEQQPVGDLAGETMVFFLDTAQEVDTYVGESFEELMLTKVDVANPLAWLALFLSLADPTDVKSYPSFASWNWEWVGALVKKDGNTYALYGRSFSGGLYLGWGDPEGSYADCRARSVVR